MTLSAGDWRQGGRWLGRHSVWPYLFIFGVVLLVGGAIRTAHIINCREWPQVTGEVVSCELVRGLLREGVAKARLEMTYAYTVAGTPYQGHRIRITGNKESYEAIRTMLKRYRRGGPVVVHHHPGNPARAVLDTSFSWGGLLPLLYGFGLVMLSVTGFLRRWRLTSAHWFDGPEPPASVGKMCFEDHLLGFLGLLTIVGIPFLWWALIKMYAGY
jgi:hypothetical protein